jgi:hypothetical protein
MALRICDYLEWSRLMSWGLRGEDGMRRLFVGVAAAGMAVVAFAGPAGAAPATERAAAAEYAGVTVTDSSVDDSGAVAVQPYQLP